MDLHQQEKVQPLPKEGPVTILIIEEDSIILKVTTRENPAGQKVLQAGSLKHITEHLQSEPATPSELEAAISTIEDGLMPIIPSIPLDRNLVSSELIIEKIAGFNPGSPDRQITIQEVESLFNRLADVAYGTPAKILGMPEDREYAAGLLFLRELMHYAGFSNLILFREQRVVE